MQLRSWMAALAVSAGLAGASISFGQVTGTVTYDGKAPAAKQINVANDPNCAKLHADKPLLDESLVADANGGVANAVVSIKLPEGANVAPPKEKAAPAVLDQKDCQYVPHVVALKAGDPLVAKNGDPFMHNVHTQPETNDPENKAMPNVGTMKLKTPKQPEYYHVKCDVHGWMSAWIAVLDNPYFAVTDATGKFTIPAGLPNGDYDIHVWHESCGEQDGKVTVKNGQGTVDFKVKKQ